MDKTKSSKNTHFDNIKFMRITYRFLMSLLITSYVSLSTTKPRFFQVEFCYLVTYITPAYVCTNLDFLMTRSHPKSELNIHQKNGNTMIQPQFILYFSYIFGL